MSSLLVVLTAAWTTAPPELLDQYGGLSSVSFDATGYFRTQRDGDRWCLVTPDGNAFLSLGVCCVRSNGDREKGSDRIPYRENILKKHGTIEAWARFTRNRLQQWGFNTRGCWSSEEVANMPYTQIFHFSHGQPIKGHLPDFFDPQFKSHVVEAARQAKRRRDDPYLIGCFLDNELPWGPDWRRGPSLFDRFVILPGDAPGKQRLIQFFKEQYGTIDRFNKIWSPEIHEWADLDGLRKLTGLDKTKAAADREAFGLIAARHYFRLTTDAVRAADPNHLILGCRFIAQTLPRVVLQAAGEFCDVVSVNFYEVGPMGRTLVRKNGDVLDRAPLDPTFQAFHRTTNKPILITEFGFRAMDSGMPNTIPPGAFIQPTVATQSDRAAKFEHYASTWISAPHCVGYHWFQYMDEPKAGRFDGENGNYGLVNICDEPYNEFIRRVTKINQTAWQRHTGNRQ